MSSSMALPLKTSFYVTAIPLVTTTNVVTIPLKAKTVALAGLKTKVRIFRTAKESVWAIREIREIRC